MEIKFYRKITYTCGSFHRILNEKESLRKEKFQDNRSEVNSEIEQILKILKKIQDTSSDENKVEKDEKSQIEIN